MSMAFIGTALLCTDITTGSCGVQGVGSEGLDVCSW